MTAARRDLVLLHGVNGTPAELDPWRDALAADFNVHTLVLLGHGGRPVPEQLTPAAFADDLVAQADALGLVAPLWLGYSFGGLMALYLAVHHPARVGGVVTVASKWRFDAASIDHITYLFSAERLASPKLQTRAAELALLHAPQDWQLLARRLRAMYAGFSLQVPLSADELQRLRVPALVLSASADPIVSPDETRALHHALRGSGLAFHPGSAHPPAQVPAQGLRAAVGEWARVQGLL